MWQEAKRTVVCRLRPRLRKRHLQCELHSTSQYINYSKYGTDSNTEDETKPKNKKPRVGKWPSATHEQSQVMITRSHLNVNMPKHMKTKLTGTAVSPKPIVKSEDSEYKKEIMKEIKTEKHFQCKPLPASKCAEIPKDMMQKHGPNYLLDNWDIETNEEHDMLAEETQIPKITHPSSRLCSKSYSLQVTMQPQTAPDEDPPISSKLSHTSPKTKTGGNVVHPSGRICSKMNTHLNPDKKGSNITNTSGCKKELKVATTRIDNLVYSSKLYSPSAPIV